MAKYQRNEQSTIKKSETLSMQLELPMAERSAWRGERLGAPVTTGSPLASLVRRGGHFLCWESAFKVGRRACDWRLSNNSQSLTQCDPHQCPPHRVLKNLPLIPAGTVDSPFASHG